MTNVTVRQ